MSGCECQPDRTQPPSNAEVLWVYMTDFGATFKKAREAKGITLDQIATETRISTRFLMAIENEEFHLLPGGIFNRGFVRTYAERIGLDPEQAVADYERVAGYPEPVAEPLRAMSAQLKPKDRKLYPVAVGALVLLIVIFYLATRQPTPAPVAQPAPTPAAPAIAPAPPAAPPQTTSAAAEPEVPLSPKEALAIDIEAHATTWIKVTADKNTVVPGEILQPGTTRRYTAQQSIDLIIGNAGGLTLKVNDQEVKRLGKSGQVREFTITPRNVKDIIG